MEMPHVNQGNDNNNNNNNNVFLLTFSCFVLLYYVLVLRSSLGLPSSLPICSHFLILLAFMLYSFCLYRVFPFLSLSFCLWFPHLWTGFPNSILFLLGIMLFCYVVFDCCLASLLFLYTNVFLFHLYFSLLQF